MADQAMLASGDAAAAAADGVVHFVVGVRVAGVTLNQVDLTKQSYYGYGDYGYYTNQMKGYYSN